MKTIVVFEDNSSLAFDETPKGVRQRAALSQQEVGIRLGIPQSTVSNFERKFGDYFRLLAGQQSPQRSERERR